MTGPLTIQMHCGTNSEMPLIMLQTSMLLLRLVELGAPWLNQNIKKEMNYRDYLKKERLSFHDKVTMMHIKSKEIE